MENKNQDSESENPFEGFLKNAETSKEMPNEKADELRRQTEQDAIDSEQAKRTDNLD